MRRVLAVLLGIVLSAGWLGAAEPVAGQCVFLGEEYRHLAAFPELFRMIRADHPAQFKPCAPCGDGCKCQLGKCPDGCATMARAAAPATDPADAFEELNAYRAANRLPPFTRDEGLFRAALAAATTRARQRLFSHTPNDFAFVPAGCKADSAGCAAYPASYGIMACGLRDDHTHAGAAVVMGDDGKAYWHVFYRGGSGRELLHYTKSVPPRPFTPVRSAVKAAVGIAARPRPAAGPTVAESITARCRAGETFVQEVKAGDVPGVPAGVHRWRMAPDGRIRWDRVIAAPADCPDGRCPLQPANPFAPRR